MEEHLVDAGHQQSGRPCRWGLKLRAVEFVVEASSGQMLPGWAVNSSWLRPQAIVGRPS